MGLQRVGPTENTHTHAQWDPERTSVKQALLSSPSLPHLVHVVLVYDDNCFSWNRPCWQVRGQGKKFFLRFCFLKIINPKEILKPKRHILGWQVLFPYKMLNWHSPCLVVIYVHVSPDSFDDPKTKEQIKPRRVLECRNRKTRPLSSFPPPCDNC